MITITKKDAIRIITKIAKDYARLLEGKNYLFIYRSRENNKIEYFETVFLARNYQHLTGIELLDNNGKLSNNSTYFYKKCLNNQITETEIRFKADGTTQLKLSVLPKLVNFIQLSKMTVVYNGSKPKLVVDRIVGTTNYCLGFTLDKSYYVPSSCLLEDIRNFGEKPSQILAVLSKKAKKGDRLYGNIQYVAKGLKLNRINLPDEVKQLIDLSKLTP